jgi:DNA-3-methyladenine glycosylase I
MLLKKRDGYRRGFTDFNREKVARNTDERIQRLTLDPGIIRRLAL